jgi:hypothetical protein
MICEAERTTLFLKYAKHFLNYSFVFEAKICKEKSIPFDAVVDHQIAALYQAKHATFNFKIPDAGWTNPFDGFQFYRSPAFVVIFWYQHRNDKRFTMIDIDMFCEEKQKSDRKSLTFERASLIGKTFTI